MVINELWIEGFQSSPRLEDYDNNSKRDRGFQQKFAVSPKFTIKSDMLGESRVIWTHDAYVVIHITLSSSQLISFTFCLTCAPGA